ncbi:MAG: glycosyltransferase [Kiritimatiellia bacterium]
MGPFSPRALNDYIPELVSESLPGTGGTCLVNLVRARLAREMPTDVITCDTQSAEPIRLWHDKNGLLKLWVVRRRKRHALRDLYLKERRLIQKALAESRASVCHANWTYEYALAALTQDRLPCVVSVHDHAGHILRMSEPRYLVHYLITQWVFRKAGYLSAVSPYAASYVSRKTGKQIPAIPNILPDIVHDAGSSPCNHTAIVSVGNWSALKNLKRALRAFHFIKPSCPDAKLKLIGPGLEVKGKADLWARARNLHTDVNFMGKLPYPHVLSHISTASALLHPSLEESFGCPVAEAMMLNVPVIAAREADGCRWLLQDGKAGTLVSGRSCRQMADAILANLQERKDVTCMVNTAKERVHQLCNAEHVLAQYDQLYQKALS